MNNLNDLNNLKNKIKILAEEMDDYSFDVRELDENERLEITQFFTSFFNSFNNKIFIKGTIKAKIYIDNNIYINGYQFGNYNVNNKTTLHFIDCKNTIILIQKKVCHITIENCDKIHIETDYGTITGLDNINSNNIVHLLKKSSVYFIDISKSQNCIYYLNENVALNTIISSYCSFNSEFKILGFDGDVLNEYRPNLSLFDIYKLYQFEKDNHNTINMFIVSSKNYDDLVENKLKRLIKGTIY